MVRFLARVLGLVIGASVVAGIVGSIAAMSFKKKAPPRPDAAADEIDLAVVMDSGAFASTAGAFRGGRAICWYGSLDLDLRAATLDPAGADLEMRTVFGGTRILVAPGVPVTASGPAIFGGRGNRAGHDPADPSRPALRISGFTVFGALEIQAAAPGDALRAWARG